MQTAAGSGKRILNLARRLAAPPANLHRQTRSAVSKVRLKWVKNKGLDHIIDRDTDVKAACLLKDFLRRSPGGAAVSARSLSPLQKTLGLTIPVLRFLRRYPTLFRESPHPRYSSLPTFSLSPAALLLHRRESAAYDGGAATRLARLLMLSNSLSLPLHVISPLRWDLGLPDDFITSVVPSFPDLFSIERRRHDGVLSLRLVSWKEELAVSELEKMNQKVLDEPSYRDFKKFVTFPMSFPRGYGSQNKVKAWMEEFQRLPYISPYEDITSIDPGSEIMEKHVVGVLHEILSLTIHKKTKRNYLRGLRGELNLPEKFTRVFTRYPGIFYLSLKCKTTTVVLREGYRKGKLVDPHPLSIVRDKFYYVMRTGVLYRDGGLEAAKLAAGENLGGDDGEHDDDDDDDDDESYEVGSSGDDQGSDGDSE